jgi:hypothetical protein
VSQELGRSVKPLANIVKAEGAEPLFQAGDAATLMMELVASGITARGL